MDFSLMDVEDNAKSFKHPYLLLLADKDKIIDNAGAQEWHKKTSTPSDKKDMKLFYKCFH